MALAGTYYFGEVGSGLFSKGQRGDNMWLSNRLILKFLVFFRIIIQKNIVNVWISQKLVVSAYSEIDVMGYGRLLLRGEVGDDGFGFGGAYHFG